jgi:flagellar protein FliO/FliZ
MFETLFGAEMPLAVRFFVAFLIMLGLIGAIAWAVRRFGTGRLGATTRGRQPRLAVIDYATVDGRRRLILVRRDNVEHLLMIGGPTDVVVEPNIVRAVAAPRDVARPPAGIEALPRAIPLPESGGSWPLQPESNGGARPGSRVEPFSEESPGRPFQPEMPARQRDTLAALADELSTRATPPVSPRSRPNIAEPHQDHRTEPRLELRKSAPPPSPAPSAPAPSAVTSPGTTFPGTTFPANTSAATTSAAAADNPAAADQSLADMAQRLEAALRKPSTDGRPAMQSHPAQTPDQGGRSDTLPPPPPPRAPRAPEQKTARPEVKPNQNKTAIYDTLEQEMANLLGRPTKT